MIRVLHVFSRLDRGGAETMIMNLYRAIDRSKIQFDFIVNQEGEHAYTNEILSLGGKIYYIPLLNFRNYFEIRRRWNEFFTEHPKYKVLHSHVRSYASVYIPIAKKHGLKTIIHSHSTSDNRGLTYLIKRILQYPLRYQADYLFACSQLAGEWLYGKKATKKTNYMVIPNAVDIDRFQFNIGKREHYRLQFGIKSDEKVFIHVGRFHPSKNHLFLLDVFDGIQKIDSNVKLILVGDGELLDQIEKKIQELKLQNKAILLGSRGDVENILQMADCFLFPSVWEGLPVTVIEAQAAGLPCLVSEKVTDEVFISNYAYKLPIDKGIGFWTNKAKEISYVRHDFRKEVGETIFDVTKTAKALSEFYLNLANV